MPSPVEKIKTDSDYLRGTLIQSLKDELTGAIAPDDTMVIKFHGSYQQDDRDVRAERLARKLEPDYSFMIRVRVPGGLLSATQWVVLDELASQQEIKTLKLTTRQAIQLHGILKGNLKKTIQGYHAVLLDSIAACGDVNRNVMCSPTPYQSVVQQEAMAFAAQISEHLLPQTRAYHEIWLDEERIFSGEEQIEPIYGKTYLPRKFKIALAIPPYNDTDVYANDIGLIAVEENGKLAGFNVVAGGGFGMTHNDTTTYPRLADELGFCTPEQTLAVCKEILTTQRDFGNREERKWARLKYTIDTMGVETFKAEVEKRCGFTLQQFRPVSFLHNSDVYGWHTDLSGKHFLVLYIEHGRVKDTPDYPLKKGLAALAQENICDFRLTGNQNLVLGNIESANIEKVKSILSEYGILQAQAQLSGIRKNSIACVALNTCSLAMAEAERYLPTLMSKIEPILDKYGLLEEDLNIRMTGCPNGCGRPYLGEIGFVGKAMGRYNLYLGAKHDGRRLNKLYKENINEDQILSHLEPLFSRYSTEREAGERFGDFVVRTGIVKATTHGTNFHE